MKNKIVTTILTIVLSASIGAGVVALGTHMVTNVPASNVAAEQVTEISEEQVKAEEEAARKAAEEKAAEEKAAKEKAEKMAAEKKAAEEKAAKEKAEKEAAEKKAAEEKAAKEKAEKEAAEEKAAREAAEKKAAEEKAAREAAEKKAAEEEAARKAAEEEARRRSEEAELKYITGTITAFGEDDTLQLRAEGCCITIVISNTTKVTIEDYMLIGDEITVGIQGPMTEKGWNAVSITDNVIHEIPEDTDEIEYDEDGHYFVDYEDLF